MDCYNAIERNLTLLGATGIEDKLQDGVPEAIAALRQAGLEVLGWRGAGDVAWALFLSISLPACTCSASLLTPFSDLDADGRQARDGH